MTNVELPRTIAATVSTAGALSAGKHTPVDATAGALTMTLPAAITGNAGAHLSVEKVDTSVNAVTVSGSIRGVGASTIVLVLAHEALEFRADAAGSWWPVAGHKTKTSLDGLYDALGAAAANKSADTIVDGTTNKAYTAAERIKLAGIATAATANRTDGATDTLLAAKADLVGGLVPTSQMPSLSLVTAVPVADQAAMLALTTAQVQPGDVAVRADGAGTFMLTATNPAVLANWLRLNAPTDAVTSVNGQQGVVVLNAANVGADAAGAATTAQAASLQKTSNLSDLGNAATARTNLGLGTAATAASTAFLAAAAQAVDSAKIAGITVTGTPAAGQAIVATSASAATWGVPAITGQYLGSAATYAALPATDTAGQAASNGDWAFLTADVVGTGTVTAPQYARGAYIYNGTTFSLAVTLGADFVIGTAAGTVAAGNDSRIVGAAQTANNLSDLGNAGTARTNLGLGNVTNTSDASKPVSTAQAAAILAAQSTVAATNTQTANYTAVLADAGAAVEMNLATANTFTIPPNSSVAFAIGTVIEVCQYGAGQTTITPGAGVTIRTASSLVTRAQYATVSLRKRATDEWIAAGDVS